MTPTLRQSVALWYAKMDAHRFVAQIWRPNIKDLSQKSVPWRFVCEWSAACSWRRNLLPSSPHFTMFVRGERRERTVFHHDLRNRVRNPAPAGTRLPHGLHPATQENVMQSEGFMDTLMSVLLSPSEAHSRNNVLKVKLEELACHFDEVFAKVRNNHHFVLAFSLIWKWNSS